MTGQLPAHRDRRAFFERIGAAMDPVRHPCPCCALPTVSARQAFEVCSVCHWDDDGQDDADAGELRGGPNDRSLAEVRLVVEHAFGRGSAEPRVQQRHFLSAGDRSVLESDADEIDDIRVASMRVLKAIVTAVGDGLAASDRAELLRMAEVIGDLHNLGE